MSVLGLYQLETSGPRCLMQGTISIDNSVSTSSLVTRLDDDRVIVTCDTEQVFDFTAQSNDNDTVTLVIISTRINSNQSDRFIDNQQPIWSRNIQITLAKPFISLDQVIIMSDEGW